MFIQISIISHKNYGQWRSEQAKNEHKNMSRIRIRKAAGL
jgi:hypothetical protein